MLKPNADEKNLTGNDRYEGYCVDLAEKLSQIGKSHFMFIYLTFINSLILNYKSFNQ